ncbi:MAG: oligosaccharide flippase family protein, partial [Candidatus Thermoplasmatota archaeon]|nr:oligosaccharide flippase family protein [Candidatus Thermoplasmatota archaeon]
MEEENESKDLLFTSITRKTLVIMLNFAIMGLIGLISWKVVSTNSPKESIGIVQFAIGFVGLFSFIMNVGIGSSHVKRISEGKDLGRCIGTFLTLKIILTVVFVVVVVTSIFIWKNVVGKGFETLDHEPVIYLMLLYFISNNLATIGAQTFIGRVEVAKYQSSILLAAAVQLVATIIVALLFNDPYMLAVTFIIGAFINFLFSMILLSKFKIKAPTFKMMKSYFIFALPIFVVSALSTLAPNIDKVFIQLFFDADSVAIYRGGQVYSQYIIQISLGLGMVLFPVFSSLKMKGKNSQIRDVIFRSERLIAMVVGPISAMLFALAIPVVTVLADA